MNRTGQIIILRIIAFVVGSIFLFWRYTMVSRYWIPREIQIIYGLLLLIGVIVMSEMDIRRQEIPNAVQLYFLGLGVARLLYDRLNWGYYIAAFLSMGILLLMVAVLSKGQFGGGDIKLMAIAGLCLGVRDVFLALAIGAILASVIGLSLIATGKITAKSPIPFGPFLGAGIFLSYLFGWKIW